MISRATTTVDVLRDSNLADVDEYGDPVQTGATPVFTDEPALIMETTVRGAVDADGRVVRQLVAHLRPDIEIRQGDRLQDADGAIYLVDTVSQQRFSPGRLLDVRLELTRTT